MIRADQARGNRCATTAPCAVAGPAARALKYRGIAWPSRVAVCPIGGAFEVNAQGQGGVARQIACPFDNEFIGTRAEVPLTEWRRVNRVKELPEFGHPNFNDPRPFGIASPANGIDVNGPPQANRLGSR